jgi:carboxymethylenebutenolidase
MDNKAEEVSAATFRPAPGVAAPMPAVVLIPAIHGINDYVLRWIARLNAKGYGVLPVDYFAGRDEPDLSTRDAMFAAIDALSDVVVLDTVRASVRGLLENPAVDGSRIATLGFCIGGAYAYMSACDNPEIAAAVNFYGRLRYAETSKPKPVSPIERAGDLKAPLLSHYGTNDTYITQADVDDFDRRLAEGGKTYELFTYRGAGHAFDEDYRPRYRPVSAAAARNRTFTFLDWYIGDRR